MKKISAVYKITNTITGDCYVGSSKNVNERWRAHKKPSRWNACPNNPLYQDFQKYGINKFKFQILTLVEPEHLKQEEQKFIEMLHPTYNNRRAKDFDVERHKEYIKGYFQAEEGKEYHRKANKKYNNQLCVYNGETLTLNALRMRFYEAGVPHPTIEAKKYLIKK